MPDLHILQQSRGKHGDEDLMLTGIRIDPTHEGPQLYTLLVVGGDDERPLTVDGRIVLFSRPEQGADALKLDKSMAGIGQAPQSLEALCDIAEALYLVNSQEGDSDGVILDCLLILDDLVRATRLHMPDAYQSLLTEVAAQLTEGVALGKILRKPTLRTQMEDALLWCVGAITVKARIL